MRYCGVRQSLSSTMIGEISDFIIFLKLRASILNNTATKWRVKIKTYPFDLMSRNYSRDFKRMLNCVSHFGSSAAVGGQVAYLSPPSAH